MTRTEVRSTLVVIVLVVVAVIALWPRDRGDDASPTAGPVASAGPSAGSGAGVPAAAVDPAALAAARGQAALSPCPAATPPAATAPATTGPLGGLVLDCLGSPGPVDLGTALAGRTTLVNLWASWCGPCREEIPAISAYAAAPGAVGVLGVSVADSPVPALDLLRGLGARYPSVSDPDAVLAPRVGAAPVLPASVLVRPDGSVAPLPPQVFADAGAVRRAVDTALRGAS